MKHSYTFFRKYSPKTIAIVAGSMSLAFLVGIETAGDVRPLVTSSIAGGSTIAGDMNHNGIVDIEDAKIALELANGYRTPTPEELDADPNQDFRITSDDVLAILETLQYTPKAPQVEL